MVRECWRPVLSSNPHSIRLCHLVVDHAPAFDMRDFVLSLTPRVRPFALDDEDGAADLRILVNILKIMPLKSDELWQILANANWSLISKLGYS